MFENSKARIPVRPLSYNDRDIALTRELIIDYGDSDAGKKGHIYITDKDDPNVLIDITKLIADSYLSNINGDNTQITINGEVYNLSQLLSELKRNEVVIVNSADSVGVPANVNYDHSSISISNNLVSVYGFGVAAEGSTPKKVNGELVWTLPDGSGELEPEPGARDNVIPALPTNDKIVLYAKPGVYTDLTTSLYPIYTVEMPTSQPRYAHFAWRLDAKVNSEIRFPSNIIWIDPEVTTITSGKSYIFTIQTWDYGVTWIVSVITF